LYTAAAFGAIHLNRCHNFLESHSKLKPGIKEHLEEIWLYQAGLYEFLLARLDIIEGLQGDPQASALAAIQQARVMLLQGRGAISTKTYQLYLPADTKARVCAAISKASRADKSKNRGIPSSSTAATKTRPDKKGKSRKNPPAPAK
jgi:hypothetical protein